MKKYSNHKFFSMLAVVFCISVLILAGSAAAKSLYVLASHHAKLFDAWNINPDGTVTKQGTYNLQYAHYPAGVAIHEPSKTLFISSESLNLEVVDATTFTSLGQLPGTQFAGLAVDDKNDILYAMKRSTRILYAYDFNRTGTTWTLTLKTGFPKTLAALYYSSGMGIALDELQDPPILWVADCGNMMVRAYNTSTWVEDTTLSFSTASTAKGAIGMGIDRRRGFIYWGSMTYAAATPPYSGSPYLYKFDQATKTITYQDVTIYDPYGGGEVVDVSVDEDTGLVYITETSHMSVWDTTTSPWSMLQRHSFGSHPATCGLAVTNVSYMPLLAVDKADDVADDDCVSVGDTITYTISFTNTGDVDLTGVIIVDTLPTEVDYVADTGGGYYDEVAHTVKWDIGEVAQGASSLIELDVKVNSEAVPESTIINYATIDSNETSPTTVDEKTDICANQPPVADPNGPYLAAANEPCPFDGTGSYDPDDDELTYSWDCGDETDPEVGETPSHVYTVAGIYDVCLIVNDGVVDSEEVCTIAVVYDPSAGFVTGGGWIWSEAGWCQLDDVCANAEGKANFGFVSKYKKGATEPTGNTEFNFSSGGLNFHSSSYEWLVVLGSNYAKFKGSGTINGEGDYKFMLWAGDGEPDTFRIKIWWEDDLDSVEHVVYDNGFDQEIGGGSIVIHTSKK